MPGAGIGSPQRAFSAIISNAFGEKAVLKPMFGAVIRTAERGRAIRVGELVRRRMRTVREKLDRE